LGAGVAAVLREIGVARAREKAGRVVNGLRPRVRGQSRQAVVKALLEARLQTVINRIAARFQDVDIGELRKRPRIDRLRARIGLIQVARAEQLRSLRTGVRQLDYTVAAEIVLHIEIPLLVVGRPQIALERQRGRWQGQREESRERVRKEERELRAQRE